MYAMGLDELADFNKTVAIHSTPPHQILSIRARAKKKFAR